MIHNNLKVESNQMVITDEWIKNIVYLYDRILFDNKKN